MKLDYVISAEAAARDLRGATTLIAVNQNITTGDELPVPVQRVVFARFMVESGDITDRPIVARWRVMHAEQILAAGEGVTTTGVPAYPDLPGHVELVLNMSF